MKKIISIIALALVGLHVQAQSLWDKSAPDDRLTFGLRAGVNFATTDADEANSTVTHYHIGLAVDYNIIKSFSISSGLYIVEKGSITIDGISLTVAKIRADGFSISAIPHTVSVTTLGEKTRGSIVNLETDIIGKYVEKLLQPTRQEKQGEISMEFLASHGF